MHRVFSTPFLVPAPAADLVAEVGVGVGDSPTAAEDSLLIDKIMMNDDSSTNTRRILLPPEEEKKRRPTKTKRTKQTKQRMKKPPDAPKRFKSSFIFFSMEKHKEIKEKMASGADSKPANITALVSEAWRTLDPLEKEKYEEMARRDKARYDIEKRNYVPPPGSILDSKRKREPGAPKRPMPAYFNYANKIRGRVKAENAGCTNGEISKILSKMWKELPDDERKGYKDSEQALWGTYRQEMVEWKKKNDGRKREKRAVANLLRQTLARSGEDVLRKRMDPHGHGHGHSHAHAHAHAHPHSETSGVAAIGSIEFPGHAGVDGVVDEQLLCLGGVPGIDTNPNTDEMLAASALRGVRGGPQEQQQQHQHQQQQQLLLQPQQQLQQQYNAFFGVNGGGTSAMNPMLGGVGVGVGTGVLGQSAAASAYGQMDMSTSSSSGFPYNQYNYHLGGNTHAMIMAQLRGAPHHHHQQYTGFPSMDQQARLTHLASLAGVQNDVTHQQQQQQQESQSQQNHLHQHNHQQQQQPIDPSVSPDSGLDMGMGNGMRNGAMGNGVVNVNVNVNDASDGCGMPF